MQFTQAAGIAIQVLVLVLAVVGIVAAVGLIRTVREARELIAQTRERLVPLLDKADVTVDAVNAEILRVDGIVSQVEEVSGTVSSTTRAATDLIRSPVDKAAEMGARFLSGLRRKRR